MNELKKQLEEELNNEVFSLKQSVLWMKRTIKQIEECIENGHIRSLNSSGEIQGQGTAIDCSVGKISTLTKTIDKF
jgi:predicted RNA-binding protein with EMAP domain